MVLQDRVALITGAARGIGRATAERFAQEGAKLALLDINQDEGKALFKELRGRGAEAVYIPGDVSRSEDVQGAVHTTLTTFGRVDILVNSAGLLLIGRDVPVAEIEEDVWHRVIAVNLTGTFLTCKYTLPEMIRGGRGVIINMASIAVFKGWDVTGAYGPSKNGVLGLTRDIARAYARDNIRANAICPGNIDTPMVSGLADHPAWKSGIAATPMQRLGRPEEIASVAVFLASDEASFVTGAAITADGGMMA